MSIEGDGAIIRMIRRARIPMGYATSRALLKMENDNDDRRARLRLRPRLWLFLSVLIKLWRRHCSLPLKICQLLQKRHVDWRWWRHHENDQKSPNTRDISFAGVRNKPGITMGYATSRALLKMENDTDDRRPQIRWWCPTHHHPRHLQHHHHGHF